MSIINPSAITMAIPDYGQDQIIGTFTNTISLGAPSASPGFTLATDTKPHGFGDSCYYQGIFTTDGGTTWNDFGSQTPNLAAPNPQFQTVDVEAMADATNINIYLINYYDSAHSSGTAHTITYKIYLLAKNTMAQPIKPLPTNQILAYDSAFNFQKIFQAGTLSLNVAGGSSGSVVTVHSLGYVPKVRAFFSPASSPAQVYAPNQVVTAIQAGSPISAPQLEIHIDTSSLTLFSDQSGFAAPGINGKIDYRIYLDS